MNEIIKFKAKRSDKQVEEVFTLEDIANLRDDFYSYENWREFTGLTDKSSIEIYRGDKIKWGGILYEVIWQSYSCEWMLQSFSEGRTYATFSRRFKHEYEVIGNIHDNPELLK